MGQKEVSAAQLAKPETLETICSNVANGGSLINLCRVWDIRYSDAVAWVYADAERKAAYELALTQRTEWEKERLLEELKSIALVSVADVFNDDGTIKPFKDMRPEVVASIAGVEVEDLFDGRGEERKFKGTVTRLKFNDKLRALELIGKKMSMFVEKHEHKVGLTLEELVAGAKRLEEKEAKGE